MLLTLWLLHLSIGLTMILKLKEEEAVFFAVWLYVLSVAWTVVGIMLWGPLLIALGTTTFIATSICVYIRVKLGNYK